MLIIMTFYKYMIRLYNNFKLGSFDASPTKGYQQFAVHVELSFSVCPTTPLLDGMLMRFWGFKVKQEGISA